MQLLERSIEKGNTAIIRSHIKRARSQADKLNELVTDLLDISKIESGEMKFNMQYFSIDELISNVTEVVEQINPEVKITRNGTVNEPVYGDEMRLEQVVANFLTNAIKYAPDSPEIIITTNTVNDRLYVSVRDFGIGLSQDHLENVFKKFYRVEETSLRFQGLGIGLYISKQIVEKHGGEIGVKSKLGEGSEFYFEINMKEG